MDSKRVSKLQSIAKTITLKLDTRQADWLKWIKLLKLWFRLALFNLVLQRKKSWLGQKQLVK